MPNKGRERLNSIKPIYGIDRTNDSPIAPHRRDFILNTPVPDRMNIVNRPEERQQEYHVHKHTKDCLETEIRLLEQEMAKLNDIRNEKGYDRNMGTSSKKGRPRKQKTQYPIFQSSTYDYYMSGEDDEEKAPNRLPNRRSVHFLDYCEVFSSISEDNWNKESRENYYP